MHNYTKNVTVFSGLKCLFSDVLPLKAPFFSTQPVHVNITQHVTRCMAHHISLRCELSGMLALGKTCSLEITDSILLLPLSPPLSPPLPPHHFPPPFPSLFSYLPPLLLFLLFLVFSYSFLFFFLFFSSHFCSLPFPFHLFLPFQFLFLLFLFCFIFLLSLVLFFLILFLLLFHLTIFLLLSLHFIFLSFSSSSLPPLLFSFLLPYQIISEQTLFCIYSEWI